MELRRIRPDELLGCVTYCPPDSPWHEIAADHEGEFRMLAVLQLPPAAESVRRSRPSARSAPTTAPRLLAHRDFSCTLGSGDG